MREGERGYAMAALLVALSVMGIMLGAALPAWRTMVQREREAELVFRGEQYVQAIDLYSRRNGGFPTSLNVLRDGRYIRKLYTDPMTNGEFQPVYLGQLAGATPGLPGQTGQPQGQGATPPAGGGQPQTGITPPMGGAQSPFGGRGQQAAGAGQVGMPAGGAIIGVTSRSTGQSLRLYNGRGRYNEWAFVSTAATQQPGAPGAPGVGVPGRGGRGGQPPGAQDGRGLQPQGGRGIGPNRGMPVPPGPGRGMPLGGPNTPQPQPRGQGRGRL